MSSTSALPPRARLALALAPALLSAACSSEPPRAGFAPAGPDVVVITVDTLRADYLGAYRGEVATPNIDGLAAGGTLFERAAAPMPLTRPSHFSIFTSLYPREHGVLNNALSLPEGVLTVTELFREQGYRTGGFTAVNLLSEEAGASRGFETFTFPEPGEKMRPGAVAVGEALDWTREVAREGSFFLWVHLFEPHAPYAPPASHRGQAARESLGWPDLKRIAGENGGDVPAEVLEDALALYRGEVAYTDELVGELLEGLGKIRPLEGMIVVFTADHGECFENGVYFEHSDCLGEAAVRVPLILRYPPGFAAGARLEAQASLIDVAPTLLRAAGLAVPEGFQGRALQEHESFGERYVLVQYPFYQERALEGRRRKQSTILSVAGDPVARLIGDEEKVGLVGEGWKYLRSGGTEELYRLLPEPEEARSLAETEPAVREGLAERLDALLEAHPLNLVDPPAINDELRETLRALGYLDS